MSALQPDDRQEGRSESAGVAIFGGQVASSDKTVLSRGMSAAAGLRPACIVLYVNEQLACAFLGSVTMPRPFYRILERKLRTFTCVLHLFC